MGSSPRHKNRAAMARALVGRTKICWDVRLRFIDPSTKIPEASRCAICDLGMRP
jgi:hypothetical protein